MQLQNVPTIRELLDAAPQKHEDRTFIKFMRDDKIIEKSFSAVRSDSLAFCRRVRHLLPEKSHIAILAQSSYEYIVCMTGILVSGHVAVPLAPDLSADEAAEILRDADAVAVLYDETFADRIDAVKAQCPKLQHTLHLGSAADFETIYREYSDDSPFAALSEIKTDPNDCALLIYTSGTTGEKKGVMLSDRALVSNTMFKPYSDIVVRRDVILSVLPLYHIFCFISDYLGPLRHGNELCLNGNVRDLFRNLLIFKPHQMRVVPMLAQALLQRIRATQAKHPELSPKQAAALVTGGNLDMMLSGGAYLDAALCRAFDALGIFLRQGYGMSEAGGKITVPDFDTAMDCVGRVMNIIDVRICGGEVQVDTPSRMIGYYKRPALTAEMLTEDGWLRTGDIGYFTDDRQLFITGRLKNLIILSNGENVSPEGIEKRFSESELVQEVLVYADGDRIVAEVFPNLQAAEQAGVSDVRAALEELTAKLNESAPPSHTITKLFFRDTPFEKTATGKIKRINQTAVKEVMA